MAKKTVRVFLLSRRVALAVGAVLFAAMAWRWPLAPRPAAR